MRRVTRITVALLALTACTDIISPPRVDPYEYRRFADVDGTLVPLAFHWPRSFLPVRIYIADGDPLRPMLDRAIDMWEALYLYGEFRAELVSDLSQADIVVQNERPTGKAAVGMALESMADQCIGETDFVPDVVAGTVQLPFEIYVWARLPDDPNLTTCYELTVLHELGHAVGIFEHSTNPDDLMSINPTRNSFSERDRATAEAAAHLPATLVPVRP
jgi:hypothetical protein